MHCFKAGCVVCPEKLMYSANPGCIRQFHFGLSRLSSSIGRFWPLTSGIVNPRDVCPVVKISVDELCWQRVWHRQPCSRSKSPQSPLLPHSVAGFELQQVVFATSTHTVYMQSGWRAVCKNNYIYVVFFFSMSYPGVWSPHNNYELFKS